MQTLRQIPDSLAALAAAAVAVKLPAEVLERLLLLDKVMPAVQVRHLAVQLQTTIQAAAVVLVRQDLTPYPVQMVEPVAMD
jgi:hypothetical protein